MADIITGAQWADALSARPSLRTELDRYTVHRLDTMLSDLADWEADDAPVERAIERLGDSLVGQALDRWADGGLPVWAQ